jgi:hypothetical protein
MVEERSRSDHDGTTLTSRTWRADLSRAEPSCRKPSPLRAVDAVQANTFSVVIVQAFDGVAVEDGGDGPSEDGSLRDGKPTENSREGSMATSLEQESVPPSEECRPVQVIFTGLYRTRLNIPGVRPQRITPTRCRRASSVLEFSATGPTS